MCLCGWVGVSLRELLHAGVQEQEWSHRGDGCGGQGARTQMPASSVGEDRAILLGFTMMTFSVLMFFVVGITTVKPYITRSKVYTFKLYVFIFFIVLH